MCAENVFAMQPHGEKITQKITRKIEHQVVLSNVCIHIVIVHWWYNFTLHFSIYKITLSFFFFSLHKSLFRNNLLIQKWRGRCGIRTWHIAVVALGLGIGWLLLVMEGRLVVVRGRSIIVLLEAGLSQSALVQRWAVLLAQLAAAAVVVRQVILQEKSMLHKSEVFKWFNH